MMSNDRDPSADIRRDQQQFHRRTLAVPEGRRPESRPAPRSAAPTTKAPFVAKGHDAVIKALQDGSRRATIVTTGDVSYTGIITGRDKYTITLQVGGIRRVFYKHAIEQFYSDEAPAVQQAALQ